MATKAENVIFGSLTDFIQEMFSVKEIDPEEVKNRMEIFSEEIRSEKDIEFYKSYIDYFTQKMKAAPEWNPEWNEETEMGKMMKAKKKDTPVKKSSLIAALSPSSPIMDEDKAPINPYDIYGYKKPEKETVVENIIKEAAIMPKPTNEKPKEEKTPQKEDIKVFGIPFTRPEKCLMTNKDMTTAPYVLLLPDQKVGVKGTIGFGHPIQFNTGYDFGHCKHNSMKIRYSFLNQSKEKPGNYIIRTEEYITPIIYKKGITNYEEVGHIEIYPIHVEAPYITNEIFVAWVVNKYIMLWGFGEMNSNLNFINKTSPDIFNDLRLSFNERGPSSFTLNQKTYERFISMKRSDVIKAVRKHETLLIGKLYNNYKNTAKNFLQVLSGVRETFRKILKDNETIKMLTDLEEGTGKEMNVRQEYLKKVSGKGQNELKSDAPPPDASYEDDDPEHVANSNKKVRMKDGDLINGILAGKGAAINDIELFDITMSEKEVG